MGDHPPVVGLDISAPNLDALQGVLQTISHPVGCAFLVAEHSDFRLSPLPASVEGPNGPLPIRYAENGAQIMGGTVYVQPADAFVRMAEGHFWLAFAPRDPHRSDTAQNIERKTLSAMNADLLAQNRHLASTNTSLRTLLESRTIATVFVDDAATIRLITAEVSRLFEHAYGRTIGQDTVIGCTLSDLVCKFDDAHFVSDLAQVTRNRCQIQREVRIDALDETFAMRINSYRTPSGEADGLVLTFVDITPQKRAERQVQQTANRLAAQYAELETLYNTVPIGLNLMDRDLRFLRINKTLAAINGLPVEAHANRLQKDLLPEAHADVAHIQQRVLDTGQPELGLVVRTQTPASPGQEREFIVDYYPVRDGGEVFAVGSCVREVTIERQLQRSIKESAIRQSVAVEAAGLGVFEWRIDEDCAHWENDRLFEITGRDPALGGISGDEFISNLLHPEDVTLFLRDLERALRRGEMSSFVRIRRQSDGAIRNIHYSGTVFRDANGHADRMIGVVADITEQTNARAAERQQKRRFQTLLDSLTAFVGLLTPDGTLLDANTTALTYGGVQPEDVIGKKFWDCWWWSYSAASQEQLRQAIARAAHGEIVRYDVPARMAHGQMIVIDFQLVPVLSDAGKVIEIVPSAVDITERVKAEERKDILLSELEHRVKNTLATIQAITRFTARASPTKEAMAASLIDRLSAMSRSHNALTAGDWSGQDLQTLIEGEVSAYLAPQAGRFTYEGDRAHLLPKEVLSLGLAMHELATNAAKYGAFSSEGGRVAFSCRAQNGRFTTLEWREIGGPSVVAPKHTGFGTFLIQTLLERDLNAAISLHYEQDGLRWILERQPEPIP